VYAVSVVLPPEDLSCCFLCVSLVFWCCCVDDETSSTVLYFAVDFLVVPTILRILLVHFLRDIMSSTIPSTPFDTVPTANVSSTPHHRFIRLSTYNIIHAGANNLNMALRALDQMHIDAGILTETKLSHNKFTHSYRGYTICATTASRTQGGVALFFRNTPQWTFEGIKVFGPNVIRCSLVSGSHRWTILGVYIPPSDSNGETLNWIEKALQNQRHPLILLGDLNLDFRALHNDRDHDIADALSLLDLQDVSNFFPHPRGRWTWSQSREGRYIRSVTDYCLSSLPYQFTHWAIKYPRYCSDHRGIIAHL